MTTTALSPFENREVVGTSIKVTKAGDGLSAALKVEPIEYENGEDVYVVLKTKVANIQFGPSKDNAEALIRLHVLETIEATVVEDAKVKPIQSLLAAQKKKIEAAEGIHPLPGLDEPPAGDEPTE